MSENYQASDINGYKDFPREYILGVEGYEDSVTLTIRVYEDVKAGSDREITDLQ